MKTLITFFILSMVPAAAFASSYLNCRSTQIINSQGDRVKLTLGSQANHKVKIYRQVRAKNISAGRSRLGFYRSHLLLEVTTKQITSPQTSTMYVGTHNNKPVVFSTQFKKVGGWYPASVLLELNGRFRNIRLTCGIVNNK